MSLILVLLSIACTVCTDNEALNGMEAGNIAKEKNVAKHHASNNNINIKRLIRNGVIAAGITAAQPHGVHGGAAFVSYHHQIHRAADSHKYPALCHDMRLNGRKKDDKHHADNMKDWFDANCGKLQKHALEAMQNNERGSKILNAVETAKQANERIQQTWKGVGGAAVEEYLTENIEKTMEFVWGFMLKSMHADISIAFALTDFGGFVIDYIPNDLMNIEQKAVARQKYFEKIEEMEEAGALEFTKFKEMMKTGKHVVAKQIAKRAIRDIVITVVTGVVGHFVV